MADLVVKESFAYTDANGAPNVIHKGTRVREGHPIVQGNEAYFEPDNTVWELPEAKRGPGRPRKTEE